MGFFLLADNLRDAVTCAVRNLKDVQLALVVCRLYEGNNSPTFYEVLREDVLPLAREHKDQVLPFFCLFVCLFVACSVLCCVVRCKC
jgi:hypothetical protein